MSQIHRVSLLAAAMEAGAVRVSPGVFAASRLPGSGSTSLPTAPAPAHVPPPQPPVAAESRWNALVRNGRAAAVIFVAL
ncbi:hypothetical protein GCM10010302_64680 [Streptomyces polychromogenes]|uniref:Uncharacterized protein n=1 Tax=Streptomyces polychromogenes TaxID=67342 RepID=A0ABP3FIR1_9ACTN